MSSPPRHVDELSKCLMAAELYFLRVMRCCEGRAEIRTGKVKSNEVSFSPFVRCLRRWIPRRNRSMAGKLRTHHDGVANLAKKIG